MNFRLETRTIKPAGLDGQRDESILNGLRVGLAEKYLQGMLAKVFNCLENLPSSRFYQEKGESV
jgi:hypothetical protein